MRRVTLSLIAYAVLAAIIFGGCGGAKIDGNNSIGAQTLRNLSTTERRILGDKFVSVPEVEDAMDRERACINSIPGAGKAHLFRKGATVSVGVAFHSSDEAEGHRRFARCQAEFDAVYAVYGLDHGPSSAERGAALSGLRHCASTAGVKTPPGASVDEIMGSISAAMKISNDPSGSSELVKCIDAYNDAAPLAPPGLAKALAALNP